jgi:hypothetical protein
VLEEAHSALSKADALNPGLEGPIEGAGRVRAAHCRHASDCSDEAAVHDRASRETSNRLHSPEFGPCCCVSKGVGLYAPLAAGIRRLAEWLRDEAAAAPQERDGRGQRTLLHGPQVPSARLCVVNGMALG